MTSHAKAPIDVKHLRSGNWTTSCSDCHSVLVAPTLEALDTLRCACPPTSINVVYLHEVTCLSCGRRIGDVVASSATAPLVVRGNPRCAICGGQPHTSGFVRCRDLTSYPKWPRPRAGRPRKEAIA